MPAAPQQLGALEGAGARLRLELELDIRTPRLLLPVSEALGDSGPMLALDMGRLRFASEALPSPSAPASASTAPSLPPTALGERAAEAESACDGVAEEMPFGGPASAGGLAGAGAEEEEVLRQRRHYDTFDVEMREMQAPLLT